MDALLIARIQKLNGVNGCSGDRMRWGHVRNYDLGMDALLIARIQKPERNYELVMDALATVCSWDTNGIRGWAWMLC